MWVEFIVGSRLARRFLVRFSSLHKNHKSPKFNWTRTEDPHENQLSPGWCAIYSLFILRFLGIKWVSSYRKKLDIDYNCLPVVERTFFFIVRLVIYKRCSLPLTFTNYTKIIQVKLRKMWGFLCRHIKAIEQYFHVVLFIMLYQVVLTFKSVDETLVCDHSNESFWAVLSCSTVYYALQGGRITSNYKVTS